jgi:glycerate 2-kinase
MSTAREDALDIFHYALKASRVEPAMEQQLASRDGVIEIDGHRYVLEEYERLVLIGIGKAAHTMSAAFLRQVGDTRERFEGIIVGPEETPAPLQRLRVYQGGHPSPNVDSMTAAANILQTLQALTERDLVVFLISGGGSALVEQFLQPVTLLETIAATHKALVESGAPIAAINAVRKHLSVVKGGRLAAAAAPAEQLTIFVSDVPAGELDALSSGPTFPDRSTVDGVYRIAKEYRLEEQLPAEIAKLITIRALVETPKEGDAIFARSRWVVLLDSTSLEKAAMERAKELGWHVEIDDRCDDWNAESAAKYLLERLSEMRRMREKVCLLSAGEVTVQVARDVTGKGGRNQHFALVTSEQIAGSESVVLSGGSDGIDGNSPAAGALVDGSTRARAEEMGYPVSAALAAFDGYTLLDRLGDTIMIGSTGNNLRDLRVLLAP